MRLAGSRANASTALAATVQHWLFAAPPSQQLCGFCPEGPKLAHVKVMFPTRTLAPEPGQWPETPHQRLSGVFQTNRDLLGQAGPDNPAGVVDLPVAELHSRPFLRGKIRQPGWVLGGPQRGRGTTTISRPPPSPGPGTARGSQPNAGHDPSTDPPEDNLDDLGVAQVKLRPLTDLEAQCRVASAPPRLRNTPTPTK